MSGLAPEEQRAHALDALAGILPMHRRDRLASLLTDDDVATLRHLAREGMGANSLRALTSDLAYLEAWARAATAAPLPWPAPETLALKFIAHHLWDPAAREKDPTHGMPAEVAARLRTDGLLRVAGPHAPDTVKRRLASWGTLHRWRGVEGPFAAPHLKLALRLALRASVRPRQRKSRRAITRDVLDRLLSTCARESPVDIRDRALLALAFASGGRRRSEVASLRLEQIVDEPPARSDPADPHAPLLPCVSILLGRTKTRDAGDDSLVYLTGPAVDALRAWIAHARLTEGAVFRAIDRWGTIEARALSPQSVNLIVKDRCARAGLDPAEYSAHGLRAGFLTEAARQGVALPEAMQQSQHRSVQQAARYYNEADRVRGRAVRL